VGSLSPATKGLLPQFGKLSQTSSLVPNDDETKAIQQHFVDINNAIAAANFAQAMTLLRQLGLPAPEADDGQLDFDNLSDQQWKTLLALGGATINQSGATQANTLNPVLNAIQGTAHYVALVDDMAECGVDPLQAPPTFDQIHKYYKNARLEESDKDKAAVTQRLLAACDKVMKGMLVHYRAAGGVNPDWGDNKLPNSFLFVDGALLVTEELRGKVPRAFASPKEVTAYEKSNSGHNYYALTQTSHTPKGYDQGLSRKVYGRRYESDCEGMASFRLRTLPPGFTIVGAVGGQQTGSNYNDGHLVAVLRAPDNNVYLSSNDKPLIRVAPGAGGKYDKDTLRDAVTAEFTAIYHGATAFDLGVAGATGPATKPGDPTAPPTDRDADRPPADWNPVVDQLLFESDIDLMLRHNAAGRSVPDIDWGRLLYSR
jgi:hypothetical protein